MVALKNLVIRVTDDLVVVINKAFMDGHRYRFKEDLGMEIVGTGYEFGHNDDYQRTTHYVKDGTLIYMDTFAMPFRGGDEVLLFLSNVTPIRQAERLIHQMERTGAIGRLAGGVAHELNNTLQAINGGTALLREKADLGSSSSRILDGMADAVNRSAALVRQLLAFSRKQTLRPQVLDLGEALTDIDRLLKRLIGEKITLEVTHEVEKAFDAMRPSLGGVKITSRIFRPATFIELALKNLVIAMIDVMGKGVSAALLASIFRTAFDMSVQIPSSSAIPKGS